MIFASPRRREIFWGPAMGRRLLGKARNRLSPVRIDSILQRQIAPVVDIELFGPYIGTNLWAILGMRRPAYEYLPAQDIGALRDVLEDPSDDELRDLYIIDQFMGPVPPIGGDVSPGTGPLCLDWNGKLAQVESSVVGEIGRDHVLPYMNRAALCPDRPSGVEIAGPDDDLWSKILYPWSQGAASRQLGGNPHVGFWDILLGERWGNYKSSINNMLQVERVLASYPFPQPFFDFGFIYGRHLVPGLRQLVASQAELNETVVRLWLTLSILAKYDAMVRDMEEYYAEQAENARRNKLMKTLSVAVVGALAGVALTAAAAPAFLSKIVTGGISAVGQFSDKRQQASLKEDLDAAQQAFADTDPRFAAEIKFAEDILKFATGEAEEAAARAREGTEAAAADGMDTTDYLVIGGIALGVAALLFWDDL